MNPSLPKLAATIALAAACLAPLAPVQAQPPSPCDDCPAADIIRIAGPQYVPEASLYLPRHLEIKAPSPVLVEDFSCLGQIVMNHPAMHLSGAEQMARVAPGVMVPEASLYLNEHVHQESGASQMARVAPGAMVPEASLFLGDQMPRPLTPGTFWASLAPTAK